MADSAPVRLHDITASFISMHPGLRVRRCRTPRLGAAEPSGEVTALTGGIGPSEAAGTQRHGDDTAGGAVERFVLIVTSVRRTPTYRVPDARFLADSICCLACCVEGSRTVGFAILITRQIHMRFAPVSGGVGPPGGAPAGFEPAHRDAWGADTGGRRHNVGGR